MRLRLAEVQAGQLKFSEARATLSPLADNASPDLHQRIERAGAYPVTQLQFPQSLERAHLYNLDGIQTPVVGPHLDLALTATNGPLFALDLEVAATEFSVSYDVDITRLELASGLYVWLRDEDGEEWLSGTQSGSGGGREINLVAGCTSEKLSANHTIPIANELDVDAHLQLHLSYNQETQQARCRIRTPQGTVVDHSWTLQAPPSRTLRLEVGSPPPTTDRGTRADIRLSRITLRGLHVVDPQDSRTHHAGLLLLSGDYAGAADAYSSAGLPEWAALAHLDGGALSQATPWLRDHPDHALTQRLHRTRREVGPVLAASEPDQYGVRVERDFSSALRYTEAPDVAAVLLHPTLDDVVPSTVALCELTRRRAGVLAQLGRAGPSLSVLDRISRQPSNTQLESCIVAADIHAAELLVGMGRPSDARERIQRAIATSSIPDITRERLQRHPILKDQVDP